MADTPYAANGYARPSTEEIGTTGIHISGNRLQEEFEKAWFQYQKARTIREMLTDPMVSRSIWTFDLLIRNVQWELQPANDDNESMRDAEFARQVLFDDQSHSWNETISNHLTMISWGWAWHEIVWKRRRGNRNRQNPGLNSQFDDGRWGLRKTAFRGQNTLWEWQMDTEGGVAGMIQLDTWAWPSRGQVTIPIENSLLFRMTNDRDSPEGRSLLRGAYIPWYRKKNIATLQGIGIERDLVGLPFIRVPTEIMISADPDVVAIKHYYERMGRNIRQDDQSYVMLSSERDENGEFVYDFSLLSTSGTSSRIDTQPVIDAQNKEILMALLTDVVMIGHEKVGSFSLHSSATKLLSYGLGGIMDSIASPYNRHLLPRIWAVNGLPRETMPTLVHGDVETVDLDELGNFIVRMAQGGFDLTDIENDIRRRAGFPMREEGVNEQ